VTAKPSLIGSHVAVGGGLVKAALGEAAEIGAEVIQVFAGNPRGWAPSRLDPPVMAAFRDQCVERGLPVFVHAPHLVNLGSPSAETREKSVVALTETLRRAAMLGAVGVVVHAGSSVLRDERGTALGRLHGLIAPMLDAAPDGVRLLIEPTAGGGEALASTVDTTLEYLAAVDDERTAVCLDTCHLHAAGEDVTTSSGLRKTVTRLTSAIGRGRLGLVHVNDSCDTRGSRRDRHESLGKGPIGLPALGALFTTPALRGVPLLVETPTHLDDVAALKALRAEARPLTRRPGRGPT
jgi:deoxyribonuclease-4